MIKKFAVVGNPIAHSRSPELHLAFAQKTAINLNYEKILAPLDGFAKTVTEFFKHGGCGLNITVPFKEQAFALCDVLTERAQIAKAVNTLWMQDGQLYGDNTDGQGLVIALQAQGWQLSKSKILILGAGGATRGVIYPLAQAGVAHITIANRTLVRAQQLITDVKPFTPALSLSAIALDQLQGEFNIVINATSASLSGEPLKLPETLQFQAAYEMAYGKASSFIEQVKEQNLPVADGWSMLVGQAAESFKRWNGCSPDIQDLLFQTPTV
ncbi:shikimate dehydrogenase [Acinetobacter qingfengensis]|uniref:Shikimate dehydrogenase (NADP(+)) n=1 Tax=Acinetobacter qingfengensis TaxID=1262585 RepID=A0A1E7RFW9_9GAMM|nr:shikimate dehydrogenase [Acinetobacter qingfengensis]KAA8732684.1 shikimate dehydrogenase [Acinetobacter qingfengensis]OEY98203.1 shikimate dehydrogenase [Acinetobacter qingfengensis]